MANRDVMLSALKEHIFPVLFKRGFAGKYPHFRCERNDHIELLSFQANKLGGSFTIEVSVVFPNRDAPNFKLFDEMTLQTLDVSATNERYRLPGMFDGWFYYSDVYRKRTLLFGKVYHSVGEKKSRTFAPPKGYKPVQKFNDSTALDICCEVNRQLEDAFTWIDNFVIRRTRK